MKKVLAILLMLCLLAGLPFSAYADQEEWDPDDDWTEEEPVEEPEQEPTVPPEEEPGEEPEPPAQEDPYAYELILPDKRFYLVGEEPDFTGGEWIYTTSNRRIPLTSRNCTGLDTSTPGNKYVRVMVGKEKVYFRVVVLDRANPILQMKDITDSHWGYEAFSLCMKAGYFAGTPEKNINPDAPITRAEMAEILTRALGLKSAAAMAEQWG